MKIKLKNSIREGRVPSQWLPKGSIWTVERITPEHPDLPGLRLLVIRGDTGREVGVPEHECEVVK